MSLTHTCFKFYVFYRISDKFNLWLINIACLFLIFSIEYALQQEVMNLMLELFDFRKVRYTSVEEMAEDVYGLSQLTVDRIAQRLGI